VDTIAQSRWGYHPVDYPTFCKLRTLQKRYWQTVYAVARWERWNRKTVNRKGEAPEYCPLFVLEKGHWEVFTRQDGKTKGSRYHTKTIVDHGVREALKIARLPAKSREDVKQISFSTEEIEQLYAEVEAWFQKQSGPCSQSGRATPSKP
jgi:hypothetical protein